MGGCESEEQTYLYLRVDPRSKAQVQYGTVYEFQATSDIQLLNTATEAQFSTEAQALNPATEAQALNPATGAQLGTQNTATEAQLTSKWHSQADGIRALFDSFR